MRAIPYGRSEGSGDHRAALSDHKMMTLADCLDTQDSIRVYRARRVRNDQARAVVHSAAESRAEPNETGCLAGLLQPLAPAVRSEGAYLVRTIDRPFLRAPADAPPESGNPAPTVPAAFGRVGRRVAVAPRLPPTSRIAGVAALMLATGIMAGALHGLDSEPPAAERAAAPSVSPVPAAPGAPALPVAVPSPPFPAAIYGHAAVIDSATLIVDGRQVHLSGIRGEPGPKAQRLRVLIARHGGVLACHARIGGYLCLLPGKLDIASWAIRAGAAKPAPDGSAAPQRAGAGR